MGFANEVLAIFGGDASRRDLRPERATDCSHGWSEAKPVESEWLEEPPRKGRRMPVPKPAPLPLRGSSPSSIASTGCATLHPWLQSSAPAGLYDVYFAGLN